MRYLVLVSAILIILNSVTSTGAQSTAFTYQGRLIESGSPVNGTIEIKFSLYDSTEDGVQVGASITLNDVVVSGGIFTVELDFNTPMPCPACFDGSPRWLEVAVRKSSDPTLRTLVPRKLIYSSPYAIKSLGANTALTAGVATNALNLGGVPASQYLQTAGAPISGDVQFTGNVLLAPAGPLQKRLGSSSAILHVVNPNPGIPDPGPANLPPAAVFGESTSGINSTVGVFGLSNGEIGLGVLGVATGSSDGTAVLGFHTATSGESTALAGTVLSPDGTAIELFAPTGGDGAIIRASSGSTKENEVTRFTVGTNGFTSVNGTLNVQGTAQVNGTLSVTGGAGNIFANNLFVSGVKNNIVTVENGRKVLFYANESPEYWFEDFGTVKLKNGRAIVRIDPTFAEATNTAIDYKVFLTPNGNSRGLYVVRKGATEFEVRESRRGRSNISFDFRIVAKRRGYEDLRY